MSVTFDAPPEQPKRSSGPGVAALIAIFAVIGIVVFGGDFETSIEQISTTTTQAPIALEDRIPGLTGTVHAIVAGSTGSKYVRWPAGQLAPVTTDLDVPAGRFNVDATSIAALEPIGDGTRANLWIGQPDDMSLAIPDVTGFAWHDSEPAFIAATRELGGIHQVWVGNATTQGYIFRSLATLPDGGVVDALGDWGIAVNLDNGRNHDILVFDPFGNLMRQYTGTTLGQRAGASGGIVIDRGDGTDPVVAYPAGESDLDLPAAGKVLQIGWAASGDRVAVSVRDGGIRLVRIIDNDQIMAESRIAVNALHWSPDGRFIVMATTTGDLSIFDTSVSTLTTVPISGDVYEVLLTEG